MQLESNAILSTLPAQEKDQNFNQESDYKKKKKSFK